MIAGTDGEVSETESPVGDSSADEDPSGGKSKA
jgi:hypothetical protein